VGPKWVAAESQAENCAAAAGYLEELAAIRQAPDRHLALVVTGGEERTVGARARVLVGKGVTEDCSPVADGSKRGRRPELASQTAHKARWLVVVPLAATLVSTGRNRKTAQAGKTLPVGELEKEQGGGLCAGSAGVRGWPGPILHSANRLLVSAENWTGVPPSRKATGPVPGQGRRLGW